MIFRNIDGELGIIGTSGIADINPTILMRTGDFAMELTAVNEDSLRYTLDI
ncbi:MAG: hypothetical protein ACJ71D_09180 [Nitrososphaera sp.]